MFMLLSLKKNILIILKKFEKKKKVRVYNFALSNFTGNSKISDIGAGSSIVEREENFFLKLLMLYLFQIL